MITVVFGARGNVGRHVAAGLAEQGGRVRLTGREPDPADFPPGAELVAADLERPETLPAALEDAKRVFLYAKPDGIEEFVAAAEAAGVERVVLLSSGAVLPDEAARNSIGRMHRIVESALEKSALEWTFIRPGMFATNALWWWQRSIREKGSVRVPYPEARTAPIHERDLAALAVTALSEPGHARRAYSAWGPEALTLRQQVQHIGAAIGREIAFEVVSVEQARADLSEIMPAIGVDAVLAGWQAGAAEPPEVSTIVEEITGRPGRTFAQWAVDHAHDFH
ncbi:NAD(P)H-binding protein [Nocardia jinanensis]|uniref:Nucleotide-diphosphate-sugar epimerase n=1 Tax=Nocardia jinanensis TaxID=382504 RepID=A0A917VRT8_9NOCA|nr:NAD(P)H-binding protein [Nocardia jinanensis]GGL07876.1 nucleotide-diphosphate-sugar epimerase [Nocardia jinanensis]